MQWEKAKTIMIWAFLVVDIILLIFLNATNFTNSKQENEMLINTLKANNLTVREEHLTSKETSIFAYEFTGLTLNQKLVSEFLKKPVKIDNNTFENEDKKSRISFNSGYLNYENENPDFKGFSGVNEKNINKKLKSYLKKLKINKYVKLTNAFSQNGDIYGEYSYFFGDMELFSSKLTFVVNEKGIKKIYGNINIPNDNQGYNFTLSDKKTILMNFVQNNKFQSPETVVSITKGYFCINYENTLLSQAIPVYKIKTVNKVYIYDARDGIEAEKRQLWSR